LKKILIVNRHGERDEALEALLKTIFPECDICRAQGIDKQSKSPGHLTLPGAKKPNKKNSGGTS
jgi:hypothetical protein